MFELGGVLFEVDDDTEERKYKNRNLDEFENADILNKDKDVNYDWNYWIHFHLSFYFDLVIFIVFENKL